MEEQICECSSGQIKKGMQCSMSRPTVSGQAKDGQVSLIPKVPKSHGRKVGIHGDRCVETVPARWGGLCV